jgi:hypothetical protein
MYVYCMYCLKFWYTAIQAIRLPSTLILAIVAGRPQFLATHFPSHFFTLWLYTLSRTESNILWLEQLTKNAWFSSNLWRCQRVEVASVLQGQLLLWMACQFNLLNLAVPLRTTRFNIQKFYMVLALRWVFCTYLRTDSDFCFTYH